MSALRVPVTIAWVSYDQYRTYLALFEENAKEAGRLSRQGE